MTREQITNFIDENNSTLVAEIVDAALYNGDILDKDGITRDATEVVKGSIEDYLNEVVEDVDLESNPAFKRMLEECITLIQEEVYMREEDDDLPEID